jgi:hypothetical protein
MFAIRLDFYATQRMQRAVKLRFPENRFEVSHGLQAETQPIALLIETERTTIYLRGPVTTVRESAKSSNLIHHVGTRSVNKLIKKTNPKEVEQAKANAPHQAVSVILKSKESVTTMSYACWTPLPSTLELQ